MAMKTVPRITLTHVREIGPGDTVWEEKLTGFGIRRQRSVRVSYIAVYRAEKGSSPTWFTIGPHGVFTPDSARDEAKKILGRAASGENPAKERAARKVASDVAHLCDSYVEDVKAGRLLTRSRKGKKASTIATDEGRITRHIKPLLGKMKVAEVTSRDIERFMNDVAAGKTAAKTKTEKKRGLANVRGGQGTATRTVGLLGSIFTYAVRRGLRPDNPVHGVIRFADNKRERRLSEAEYKALSAGLIKCSNSVWPPALAAARMLLLTGWRRGEVIGLKWEEVDLDRRTAILGDTKTGRSVRPLASAVCKIVKAQRKSDGYVFAASRGEGPMSGFPSFWRKIVSAAELPSDVTPHVLRHSFASLASDLGYSEATIAALIGHARHGTTARYVHAADAVLLSAADAVAERIVELCGGAGA